MIKTTDSQKLFLVHCLADGLQKLGFGAQITPRSLEQQGDELSRILRDAFATPASTPLRACASFDPPDPYAEGLRKLRDALPPRRPAPSPTPRRAENDYTAPDPYETALSELRKKESR